MPSKRRNGWSDLVDHLVELRQRLDTLEAIAVENAAGADPLAEILARLDAFENRLATLETRQRRPPPFPITVIENHRFQGAVDAWTSCRANWPPNDTSALVAIVICIMRSRASTARWRRSTAASTNARRNSSDARAGGGHRGRKQGAETMKDVCSRMNKPKGPTVGSPAQLVKVQHAPGVRPAATGGGA